jgi:hypothetical protein
MTNEIYYRYLIERSPAWQKPLIRLAERLNRQVGVQGHSPFPAGS